MSAGEVVSEDLGRGLSVLGVLGLDCHRDGDMRAPALSFRPGRVQHFLDQGMAESIDGLPSVRGDGQEIRLPESRQGAETLVRAPSCHARQEAHRNIPPNHRGSLQDIPGVVPQPRHPIEYDLGHLFRGRRHRLGAPALARVAQQFFEEERIAVGASDHLTRNRSPGPQRSAERARILVIEPSEVDHPGELVAQPGDSIIRAVGEHLEHLAMAQGVMHDLETVEGGRIGPRDVVNHEDHRPLLPAGLHEPGQSGPDAELQGVRFRVSNRPEVLADSEHLQQVRQVSWVQTTLSQTGLDATDHKIAWRHRREITELTQDLDDQTVGEETVVGRARYGHRTHGLRAKPPHELAEQPRLPDARLTHHTGNAASNLGSGVEPGLELLQFAGSPDERGPEVEALMDRDELTERIEAEHTVLEVLLGSPYFWVGHTSLGGMPRVDGKSIEQGSGKWRRAGAAGACHPKALHHEGQLLVERRSPGTIAVRHRPIHPARALRILAQRVSTVAAEMYSP